MGVSVSDNPLLFLVDNLFTFYIIALILRGILSLASADFYNPVSQFVFKLTEPPLSILRKFIPVAGRWDMSCWVFAWLLGVAETWLISVILGYAFSPPQAAFAAVVTLSLLVIRIYIFAIFALAISSWFVSGRQALSHPAISLLFAVTEPALAPFRRIMPSLGVIDISPLAAIFALYFLMSVIRHIAAWVAVVVF